MLMTWHTKFSFQKSAKDLENDRLRKQIDDAWALVELVQEGGRPAEPAFYMWQHHLPALIIAGMCYSMEWSFVRGFKDPLFWNFSRLADSMCKDGHIKGQEGRFEYVTPPWFRDPDVCRSHRSHLMAAEPEVYDEDLWPGTPKRMPILWPVVGPDRAVAEIRVSKADLALVRSKKLVVPSSIKSQVVNL